MWRLYSRPEDGADAFGCLRESSAWHSFQDTMAPGVTGENALPNTAIAAVVQHNTSGIISRKGEGMDSPKGLEGKKYATWDAPIEKAMMKNVVEGDGGDFSKVELIPSTVTDEVSAIKDKICGRNLGVLCLGRRGNRGGKAGYRLFCL